MNADAKAYTIPMIASKEDLRGLDARSFPAYCFLREKEYNFLKKIAAGDFKITLLSEKRRRILARLERLT